MNKFLKMFLFLVITFALAATSIPVSKTKWSDEIRAQVEAHRAARRQKMEAQMSHHGKDAPHKEEHNTQLGRNTSASRPETSQENAVAKNPRKVPKPKPAELSWKAAAEIPIFLAQCGLPFLITAFVTLAIHRRRINRKTKMKEQ